MKKLTLFIAAVCIAFMSYGQQVSDDPVSLDALSKNVAKIEKSLLESIGRINGLRNSQNALETKVIDRITQSEVRVDEKLAAFTNQIEQFQSVSQQEISGVHDEIATLQCQYEKTLRRQKIHFIIMYILIFTMLLGLVFVYVYLSKLFKDFDKFTKSRIDDLSKETQLSIDANHKHLVSKLETACDEVKAGQAKTEQMVFDFKTEMDGQLNSMKVGFDSHLKDAAKQIEKIHTQVVKHEQSIHEQQIMKTELSNLAKTTAELSKKVETEIVKKQKSTTAVKKATPKKAK